MKSQKEETPDKLKQTVEAFNQYIESLPDEKLDQIIADIEAIGIKGPSVDEYFSGLSRRETPEKPDFEKMANDYFDEINILEWPGKRDCYKAGAERIWRDYVVASKDVDKKEVTEMIAKVHEDIEGRYDLDGYDKGIIHSLLCKLQ